MPITVFIDQQTGQPMADTPHGEFGMGFKPTPPTVRARFKAFRDVHPVVPSSQWQTINRRTTMGKKFILNQGRTSGCVGGASTGAMMRCREMAGYTFQRLSQGFTYSLVNGGSDNGASIGEALTALMQYGTCTEAECPYNQIYSRQMPKSFYQTALRFRIEEGYTANSWDEFCSGIALGYVGVHAVQVGRNFDSFDSNDVIGFDRGSGNHAIATDGLKQLSSGVWVLDDFNDWSTSWGQDGRMCVSQQSYDGCDQDAFLIRAVTLDPQDPTQPPPVVP